MKRFRLTGLLVGLVLAATPIIAAAEGEIEAGRVKAYTLSLIHI